MQYKGFIVNKKKGSLESTTEADVFVVEKPKTFVVPYTEEPTHAINLGQAKELAGKINVVNVDSQYLTTYDLLCESSIPTMYIFNNSGSIDSVNVVIKNGTKCPKIILAGRAFGGQQGSNTEKAKLTFSFENRVSAFTPENYINAIEEDHSAELVQEYFIEDQGLIYSGYIIRGHLMRKVGNKDWTPTFRDSLGSSASNAISIPGLTLSGGKYNEEAKRAIFFISVDRSLINTSNLSQKIIIQLPFSNFLAGQIGTWSLFVSNWNRGANNVLDAVNHYYAYAFPANPTIGPKNNNTKDLTVGDVYNVSDTQITFSMMFEVDLMPSN